MRSFTLPLYQAPQLAADIPRPSADGYEIKRGDYAAALALIGAPHLGSGLRRGEAEQDVKSVIFVSVDWLGNSFVSAIEGPGPSLFEGAVDVGARRVRPVRTFAIEKNIWEHVLKAFSYPPTEDALPDTVVVPDHLQNLAREEGGALFPNGFAVVPKKNPYERKFWFWNAREGALREAQGSI